ncbi:RNA polymerase sigma factor [Coralloluteibacterium stylophorae]|uniref:RNA polymerase sigma factor n=1 Tax=Coralloluteibacterium stylophorae TaxID=1776034 RepID=A0A8J7VTV5_9GAMM|nr:RNA polymerase sigma factor [Coralloluteibacterium stylophorae]MBS7458645.1 RNA polymerase sigma factor [Coralloluteibacterium stylophorae]
MDELDDDTLRALIPRLRRFARSLVHEPAAADDLVQHTLERALTHGRTRRDAGALQPWLFSILYRQFVDEHRRAARWSRLVRLFATQDDGAPSAETVAGDRAALAAFDALPAAQRALLLMVTVEGFSYREVAQALDVPLGTVMSRLARARQALRALTEGEQPRPALRILK